MLFFFLLGVIGRLHGARNDMDDKGAEAIITHSFASDQLRAARKEPFVLYTSCIFKYVVMAADMMHVWPIHQDTTKLQAVSWVSSGSSLI